MKKILANLMVAIVAFSAPLFWQPALASAACSGVKAGSSQDQVLGGAGQAGSKCDDSQVTNTISAVVKILSYIVGVVAIIMILWGGFKYITSAGDSGKVTQAKQTLIYALVGVIVAALAQVLVTLALSASNASKESKSPSCPQGQHYNKSKKKCIDD